MDEPACTLDAGADGREVALDRLDVFHAPPERAFLETSLRRLARGASMKPVHIYRVLLWISVLSLLASLFSCGDTRSLSSARAAEAVLIDPVSQTVPWRRAPHIDAHSGHATATL